MQMQLIIITPTIIINYIIHHKNYWI